VQEAAGCEGKMKNIHIIHIAIPDDVKEKLQQEVFVRAVMGSLDKETYADGLLALVVIAIEKGENVIVLKSREQTNGKGE